MMMRCTRMISLLRIQGVSSILEARVPHKERTCIFLVPWFGSHSQQAGRFRGCRARSTVPTVLKEAQGEDKRSKIEIGGSRPVEIFCAPSRDCASGCRG